ncbi:MAG: TatD family hydrolase, partial [Patescibacteria group bacterium]
MIDSHAHVAFYQFDGDRDSVISRAHEAGVSWIEIGTDLEQSRRALELARQYGGRSSLLGVTIGVHPSDVGQGINWAEIEKLLDEPKVVAIGEVGIDLYHQDNLEEQLEALESFIGLAREKNLPVVFHVRNSNPPPPPPLSRRGDESSSLDKGRI